MKILENALLFHCFSQNNIKNELENWSLQNFFKTFVHVVEQPNKSFQSLYFLDPCQ